MNTGTILLIGIGAFFLINRKKTLAQQIIDGLGYNGDTNLENFIKSKTEAELLQLASDNQITITPYDRVK